MASEPRVRCKQSDGNMEYDERLDFFSAKFDPLLALSTPDLKPPIVNAKTYDNLSKYHSAHNLKTNHSNAQSSSSKQNEQKRLQRHQEDNVRNFLPHQMPTLSVKVKSNKSVVTRMDEMEGPLAVLKKCKDERLLVKVWTRYGHRLRGYCQAYVTAFDKHWNISLEDVTEVWTRPKKRKMPAIGEHLEPLNPKNVQKYFPEIVIEKSDKKTETCRRYVDQFFIRGEHVAYIIVMDYPKRELPQKNKKIIKIDNNDTKVDGSITVDSTICNLTGIESNIRDTIGSTNLTDDTNKSIQLNITHLKMPASTIVDDICNPNLLLAHDVPISSLVKSIMSNLKSNLVMPKTIDESITSINETKGPKITDSIKPDLNEINTQNISNLQLKNINLIMDLHDENLNKPNLTECTNLNLLNSTLKDKLNVINLTSKSNCSDDEPNLSNKSNCSDDEPNLIIEESQIISNLNNDASKPKINGNLSIPSLAIEPLIKDIPKNTNESTILNKPDELNVKANQVKTSFKDKLDKLESRMITDTKSTRTLSSKLYDNPTPNISIKSTQSNDNSTHIISTKLSDSAPIVSTKLNDISTAVAFTESTKLSDFTPNVSTKLNNISTAVAFTESTNISDFTPNVSTKLNDISTAVAFTESTKLSDFTPIVSTKLNDISTAVPFTESIKLSDFTPNVSTKLNDISTAVPSTESIKLSDFTPNASTKLNDISTAVALTESTKLSDFTPNVSTKLNDISTAVALTESTKLSDFTPNVSTKLNDISTAVALTESTKLSDFTPIVSTKLNDISTAVALTESTKLSDFTPIVSTKLNDISTAVALTESTKLSDFTPIVSTKLNDFPTAVALTESTKLSDFTPNVSTKLNDISTAVALTESTKLSDFTPNVSTKLNDISTAVALTESTKLSDFTPNVSTKLNNISKACASTESTNLSDLAPIVSTKLNDISTACASTESIKLSDFTPIVSTKLNDILTAVATTESTKLSDFTPIVSTKLNDIETAVASIESTKLSDFAPIVSTKLNYISTASVSPESTKLSDFTPIVTTKLNDKTSPNLSKKLDDKSTPRSSIKLINNSTLRVSAESTQTNDAIQLNMSETITLNSTINKLKARMGDVIDNELKLPCFSETNLTNKSTTKLLTKSTTETNALEASLKCFNALDATINKLKSRMTNASLPKLVDASVITNIKEDPTLSHAVDATADLATIIFNPLHTESNLT